jgi:hypothetical protein
LVPAYRHTIEVRRVDPVARTIATHEHGGILRRWDHTLAVEPSGPGRARYRDTLTIDAGRLTPVVAAIATAIFRHRHRHRRWRTLARRHLDGS